MALVTLDDLRLALKNRLCKEGITETDTEQLAEYVMSFFRFSDQAIDNRLTPEDRDVFYMLEEEGFLTTRQEEVHIERGKVWRIHYWVLKTDQIRRIAHQQDNGLSETDGLSMCYEEVPDDCWQRGK